MAKTVNYNWPLPNPYGMQIAEINSIVTTFSLVDAQLKLFETAFATHKHAFADITGRPNTLGGYGITDGMTADEVASAIKTAVDDLVNGSGAALDTLAELAAALGNDPDFAVNVSKSLGLRVRVDAAQGLSVAQKTQARQNIDAIGAAEKGAANGLAPLGQNSVVPLNYLPAYKDFPGLLDAINSKLDKSGGTITGNLLMMAQSLYIQSASNRHLWFKDENGTERGLLYSQASDNSVRIRVNGSRYFNFQTDGSFTLNGDVNAGTGSLIGAGGEAVYEGGSTQSVTGVKRYTGPGTNIGGNADQALTVMSGGSSTDAFMSFLSNGNYRVQFGVRSDRYLYRGGGTLGAVAYRLWDAQNLPTGDANNILSGGGDYRVYVGASLLTAINNRASAYANGRMIGFGGGYNQFSWGASESKWQNTTGRLVFLYFTYDVGPNNRNVSWAISDGDNGNWQSIGSNSAGARTIVVPPGFWIRGSIGGSGASITLRMYW